MHHQPAVLLECSMTQCTTQRERFATWTEVCVVQIERGVVLVDGERCGEVHLESRGF